MKTIPTIFILSLAIAAVSAANRGLAWPWNGVSDDFALFTNPPNTWVYNWESYLPQGIPSNMEYVAMQRTADSIDQLQGNMAGNGAKVLLGFNEPDNAGQANMQPDQAIQLWNQYIQPFAASGIRLGSPAITNGPTGLPWLQSFVSGCTGCQIDFVCMHWYGTDINDFQNQVNSVSGAFPGKNVWVTEFSMNLGTPADQQKAFMDQAIPWLESQAFVERYAWFGAMRDPSAVGDASQDGGALINPNGGSLTDLGNDYNTQPTSGFPPAAPATSGLATSTATSKARRCIRSSRR